MKQNYRYLFILPLVSLQTAEAAQLPLFYDIGRMIGRTY
jgi:hypothetical protein